MLAARTITSVSVAMGILIAFGIIRLIGTIAGIIGLINIRNGFGTLKNLGIDVGIGYAGATLYFIAVIIVIIRALAGLPFLWEV